MGSESHHDAGKVLSMETRMGVTQESKGKQTFSPSAQSSFPPTPKQPMSEQVIHQPRPTHRIPRVPLPSSSRRDRSSEESNQPSWAELSSSMFDARSPPPFKIQRKEVQSSIVLPEQPSSPNHPFSPNNNNINSRHRSFVASVGGLTTLPTAKSNGETISSVSPRQSIVERLEAAREWARLGLRRGLSWRSKVSGESNWVNTGEGELEGEGVRRVERSKSGNMVEGSQSIIIEECREIEGAQDIGSAVEHNNQMSEIVQIGMERGYGLGISTNPISPGYYRQSASGTNITRKTEPIRMLSAATPEVLRLNIEPEQPMRITERTFLASPTSVDMPEFDMNAEQANPATLLITQQESSPWPASWPLPMNVVLQPENNNDIETLETNALALSSVNSLRRCVTNEYGNMELDWDGPDDPDNPRNWCLRKKCFNTFIVALYTAMVCFTSSIYLPAYHDIQRIFKVSEILAVMGFSIYVFGLCLGTLLGEPLAMLMGRKILFGILLPLSALFIMGSGLSQAFWAILMCRFLSALFAGPAVAVGAGSITSIWTAEQTALPTMVYIFLQYSAVILGPIIGGYAVQFGGWRWTSWIALILSAIIYMLSYFISETNKRTILAKREKGRERKRRKKEPPSHMSSVTRREYQAQMQRQNAKLPPSSSRRATSSFKHFFSLFILPLRILVLETLVFALSIYASFTFGILVHILLSFPYIFQTFYSFDLLSSNLTILAILFGFFLSFCFEIVLHKTLYKTAQNRLDMSLGRAIGGKVPPEERLWGMLLGSILLPLSLFIFGWTAWAHARNLTHIHPSVPIGLGGIPLGFASYSILSTSFLYLIETFEISSHPSAAMQSINFLAYIMAFSFPLFTLSLYRNIGSGEASTILGALGFGFGIVPWYIWRWGREFREYEKGESGGSRRSVFTRQQMKEGEQYGWKVGVFSERERWKGRRK